MQISGILRTVANRWTMSYGGAGGLRRQKAAYALLPGRRHFYDDLFSLRIDHTLQMQEN
jgi:hypothetical protein